MIDNIKDLLDISPKFIVDSEGVKLAVILELSTYEKMLVCLEDHYFGLKAKQALKEGEYIDFNEANNNVGKDK